MPYNIERTCADIDIGEIFQAIDRILAVTVGADARDPLDHTEFIIPRTTPMAPCHTGEDHDMGIWMPIRRTRAADAEVVGDTEIIVDDAEPFIIGDTVGIIGATGPGTTTVDGGALTAVDYATNTLSMTNGAAIWGIDDWVQVTENGVCDIANAVWYFNRLVGMLKDALDVRAVPTDATGQPTLIEVVAHGSIRAADINFNTTAALDHILHWEFAQFSPASGGIQIIELEHGDELPNLPDAALGL